MTLRLGFVALGLAGWLTAPVAAADDVEVLARPGARGVRRAERARAGPTPVIPKEPPKPIEELPPDQKPEGDNVQWMPGYWAWDDDKKDFLWVSGFWRNVPPDRTWVPGSWRKAQDGWQWTGGFWAAAKDGGKADIEYLPQPPAPLDAGGATTPAPSETHVYIPGTWVYRERYVWRPGFWFEYRPGWVWVAAHYRWTPAGYIFIDGYWDYPLAERGVLFAPAYIPPVVYTAPAFVYTPDLRDPRGVPVRRLLLPPRVWGVLLRGLLRPELRPARVHGLVRARRHLGLVRRRRLVRPDVRLLPLRVPARPVLAGRGVRSVRRSVPRGLPAAAGHTRPADHGH